MRNSLYHRGMELSFTKMHGLGNDFVVVDAISQTVELSTAQIRFIADRHRGVGCDQLLLVERPSLQEMDFKYRIFNQDGGEVEQCGNGVRCFARFVVDKGLTNKAEIAVETSAGVVSTRLEANGQVTVDMGVPSFEPKTLPFLTKVEKDRYIMALNGDTVELGAVSVGNPHAVIQVEDVDLAPLSEWGPAIEGHPDFPNRVNVGFVQVVARDHLRLRVFERGVGETQACGSGACAAVAVMNRWGLVDDEVSVDLPGGQLLIRCTGNESPILMTGPAEQVFEGTIRI